MHNIVFLIFRRMRLPLLTLLVVYSIAVLGLVLIPGQDADGNVWHMGFFHAFYFVSYMATTIGFGEIPYPFTDAQRLWVTAFVYITVISWLYAIGTILTLLQDKTFQQAIVELRFARRIRRLREPFYLVCGYGETGSALVRALVGRGQHSVVIDIDEARTSLTRLQDLRESVPALHADASETVHLLEAGLEHEQCAAVVALTNSNEVNLKIAITSKLLHPDIKVICRADSHDVEANMASFGTDYIIDPFDTFALYLSTALQSPCLYLLQRWLTGEEHATLTDPVYPPRAGRWIICGYGRFGKAIYQRLKAEGITPVVIEADPSLTGIPEEGCVKGRGTEAKTLEEAGIDKAVGLVAGTDDDANNLSIIMTAREMQPDLFVIARQNVRDNARIVEAAGADMVMHPSAIIADKIRVLLATPMLYQFVSLASYQDDQWSCELVSRITALVQSEVPAIREIKIEGDQFCAIHNVLQQGRVVTVGDLLRDPLDRDSRLNCIALLLEHAAEHTLLPNEETRLKVGDKLLFCGDPSAFTRMYWTLCHENTLIYATTGKTEPTSWLWRKLAKK